MKIKLKSLTLENYKKFIDPITFDFYDRTKISGKNQEGKSTLENAYMEILTGKEVDGTQPDGIRPHNTNGEDRNRADVIREVVLDIDGKETNIRKITKQKWRKPHGQTEEVLDGNAVSYEIDGFPYAPKKFEEYIKGLVDPEILLMCSNPNHFLSILKKSTADARKVLEKLSGFSLEDFIASNSQYEAVQNLTKGHSVEDTMKKLRKQFNEQKKKLTQKDTELKYEQTRDSGVQIEIADLELAKGEWREKISYIDRQEQALDEAVNAYDAANSEILSMKSKLNEIANSAGAGLREQRTNLDQKQEQALDEAVNAYDAANSEILSMKSKLNEIANSAGAGLREQRTNLDQKISELNIQNKGYANDMKLAEIDLQHAHMGIERHKKELEKARTDYSAASQKTFDETKLHEIEAEQFDEDSLICPGCGQVRPEAQRANLRETFEQSKARRIAEQKKAKEVFNAELSKMLDGIIEIGNKAADDLKVAQEAKKEAEKKIAEVRKQILETSAEIEKLCGELEKIPKEVDLSGNAKYQELSEQIKKKEFALSAMNNGSMKRMELRQQRNQYMDEISKLDAQIQKSNADAEQKERKLTELKEEFDKQKQAVADIERQIDVISQFSIEKNAALADKINPFMNGFKFNFLTYTLENNPVECCQIIRNGTEYSNLNYSDRLLVETAMIRGFQKMNNLDLLIWIDNSESINDERLPELDTQMIVLKVTDNELKVEEMK